MAQHFLLSAKARTLSLKAIYSAGEEKAYETFCAIRWHDTDGEPVCPRCGCIGAYAITKRRQFECKGCKHHFSVTARTMFASRKMAFVDLLAAICIFVNGAKGLSALQLSRDLDCQYKTAFVLSHKLREAMAAENATIQLGGVCEVDGAHFGGTIRPENRKEDRKDRRLAEHQTGQRRVVIAIRERKGRTLTHVVRHESDGVDFVTRMVPPSTIVHADEASHWDVLHQQFQAHRINHSEAFSLDGACTNLVESFFSRLRRMVDGQHHKVSPRYLYQYANHAAWLEDHRRLDNGTLARRVVGLGLASQPSRQWAGYWQRAA